MSILSSLIFYPMMLGFVIYFFKSEKIYLNLTKVFSGSCLALASFALFGYYTTPNLIHGYGLSENITLVKDLGISYSLEGNGLNLLMIFLTTLLTFLAVVYSNKKSRFFYTLLLSLNGVINAIFCLTDALIFYIFLEISIVLMFFIIAVWGGKEKQQALLKYCLYSLLAGVILLLGIIYVQFHLNSFNLYDWSTEAESVLSIHEQKWVFWVFLVAFGIKVPMFLLHFWLAQTHTQAPVGGSIILSGILLKVGTYGILRFVIEVFPNMASHYMIPVMSVCVLGVVYASILAYFEKEDIKKVIAYSSIVHMNIICIGLFTLNETSIQGAIIQMFTHGLTAAGLFIAVDIIERRLGTREFSKISQLNQYMPKFKLIFIILMIDSIGLPFTGSFAGKILVLFGLYESSTVIFYLLMSSLLISSIYVINFYTKIFYNKNKLSKAVTITDLTFKEKAVLYTISAMIITVGVLPNLIINLTSNNASWLVNIGLI